MQSFLSCPCFSCPVCRQSSVRTDVHWQRGEKGDAESGTHVKTIPVAAGPGG